MKGLIIPKGFVIKDMIKAISKRSVPDKYGNHKDKRKLYKLNLANFKKMWLIAPVEVKNQIIQENMGYKLYGFDKRQRAILAEAEKKEEALSESK